MTSVVDRFVRRGHDLMLTFGAVVGVLCLLAALAVPLLDVRPMVFRSGSMGPAIDTGALALVHRVDAADLSEGDIVSVPTAAGSRVTHRIVWITHRTGVATLQMQGDANDVADAEVYQVGHADRVVASVPRVGYVVGWFTGPAGRFLLGLYAAYLLSVILRKRDRDEPFDDPPGRHRRPEARALSRHTARSVTVVALAAALGAVGVARATPSWAAWSDAVAVSGTSLSAHAVLAPDAVSCSASGATATMSWAEKDSRYDYEVVLKDEDGTVVSTRQLTGTATSTAYTAPSGFSMGGFGLGQYYFTVEVRSYLASPTTWRGAAVRVSSERIRVTVATILTSAACVA